MAEAEILGCFDDILLFVPRCLPSTFPSLSDICWVSGLPQQGVEQHATEGDQALPIGQIPRLPVPSVALFHGVGFHEQLAVSASVAWKIFLRCSGLV